MSMEINFDYKANDPFSVSYPFRNAMHILVNSQMKHHYDAFPFIKAANIQSYINDKMVCAILENCNSNVPGIGTLKDETIISKSKDLIAKTRFPTYEQLKETFGESNFSYDKFIYCGAAENYFACSNHFFELIVPWLNEKVIPRILDENKQRVLDAIPSPPFYDLENILSNIYVLEDDENCTQGTCFHLKGIGLITCQHAINSEHLQIFSHRNINKKFNVTVISEDSTIDIAHISTPEIELNQGLELGSADNLNQMDHLAIAGFPNYRNGDSGSLSPGIITGFRIVSSIRRILVNTPIIAGNSGGPAIDAKGKVIGVAITGADRMESSNGTENHGVVPIDALRFIISLKTNSN